MSYTKEDLHNLQYSGYADVKVGINKVGRVKATLDVPLKGGAIGSKGLGIFLPAGAIVKRAFYVTRNTLTSATDAATLALQIEGADDLVAAVAISDGANPWDAGAPKACIPDDTVPNFIVTTAERELTAVIAVEDLTAGKVDLYVEYEV